MTLAYQEHYTFRDYQQWKGDWELIHGAPYAMSPSPSINHQRLEKTLLLQLDQALANCLQCEALAEIDWQCSDDTVVRPDIIVACNLQTDQLTTTPELIAEIISPSSAKRDEQIKFELYEKEGVKHYFIVYPEERKVKAYSLKDGRFIKTADFSNETHSFLIKDCSVSINFDLVWHKT